MAMIRLPLLRAHLFLQLCWVQPHSFPNHKGTSREGRPERVGKSTHLHPEQEAICQVKTNNVSKTYLRKSQRKIQGHGFISSF